VSGDFSISGSWSRFRAFAARAWFFIFVLLVTLFLLRHRTELAELRHFPIVRPQWLLLTSAAQGLVLLSIIWQLRLLLAASGFSVPLSRLFRADLHRVAVSTVTPAGSAAGVLVFAADLQAAGVPTTAAAAATVTYGVVGLFSFLLLLPLTVLLLGTRQLISLPLSLLLFLGALVPIVLLLLLPWALRHGMQRLSRMSLVRGFVETARSYRISVLGRVLVLALAVDLLNVAILYGGVRVVGGALTLAEALIAYQGAYLFAFLIPFAQGSGAVELAGTSLLTALGLPAPTALAAVLLWRAHELWFPFLLGTALSVQREPVIRRALDRLPALLLLWSGIVGMVGLLEPHHHRVVPRRLETTGLLEPWEFSRNLELLVAFLSIIIAWQVWRRKRTGWLVATLLLSVSLFHQLIGRRDELLLALTMLALGLLLVRWRTYRVRSDIPSIWRGLALAGLGLTTTLLYGTIGLMLLSRHALVPKHLSFWDALTVLIRSAWGFLPWAVEPVSRYGGWFLDSVTLLAGASLLNAAWSIGRPVIWRSWGYESERQRARAIIQACGNSSLDFFKFWPDKLFFFPREVRGVVSYRIVGRVALVLGDPNVCGERFGTALDGFLDFCDLNDWEPAFHQVGEQYLADYRARGLRFFKIGEEAVVDLTTWSLDRPGLKELRYLVRRSQRENYRFEVLEPPLPDDVVEELADVSNEWLSLPGRREHGFTQGQFSRAYVRSTPVALIRDPTGKVVAFANLIPSGVPGQATIDLMRRRHQPYGAMDVLFALLFQWLREQGYTSFSLGLAPLSGVDLPLVGTDPIREHFFRLIEPFFSVQGLRHFKAKFDPRWEPRFLVFRSASALPAIGLALLKATSTEVSHVDSDLPELQIA
jgi:phosphatidylglycerol lysyltransferase